MKKVKVHEVITYCWECPECEDWIEMGEDTIDKEILYCPECDKEFESEPAQEKK